MAKKEIKSCTPGVFMKTTPHTDKKNRTYISIHSKLVDGENIQHERIMDIYGFTVVDEQMIANAKLVVNMKQMATLIIEHREALLLKKELSYQDNFFKITAEQIIKNIS